MSVLDQLEESFETLGLVDGGGAYGPDDWVVANSALSAHKAMVKGHDSGRSAKQILNSDSFVPGERPRQVGGIVDVTKSIQLSQSYQEILVRSQQTPIGLRPTADDVVDGGIKNGSKVVMQIVSENNNSKTWDEQVKSNIRTSAVDGVFFDKFSVASFVESEDERYQIHETFGADIIQSFGRRPRFLTIAGIVVNGKMDVRIGGETRSMDWKNAFQRAYEKNFSLKACLENRKKVRVYFQDTVYDGYLLQMTAATDAENQGISQVTVRFVVQRRFFPENNDSLIPGAFTTRDGEPTSFRLSGADVPDEFFPPERIEYYFKQSYSNLLASARLLLIDDRRTLAQRLAQLDGGVDADTIIARAEYIILAENEDEEAQAFIDLELKQNYFQGVNLTQLLQGGNISNTIKFVQGSRNPEIDLLTFKGTTSRISTANAIAESILEKQREIYNLNEATETEAAAVNTIAATTLFA